VPALIQRTAGLSRIASFFGRHVVGTILVGPKQGAIAANDFVRGEAEDLFRAGVPTRDEAVGVDRQDRIVGDALEDKTEVLLALLQRRLYLAAARLLLRQ
jgi:hypothetical protein